MINYKVDEKGRKHIISAQALHTTANIDFEIVEVSQYADMNKLIYDDNNKIAEDKEKLELQEKIEEMAEIIINKEFEEIEKEI